MRSNSARDLKAIRENEGTMKTPLPPNYNATRWTVQSDWQTFKSLTLNEAKSVIAECKAFGERVKLSTKLRDGRTLVIKV